MSDKLRQTEQLSPVQRLETEASRVREIFSVLVRYGLADWLAAFNVSAFEDPQAAPDETVADQTKEQRIRLALIELGPTFIKLGQLLSTRPDIAGIELAQELSKLQNDVPFDPPAVVATTLVQELGRPVKDLFAAFEEEPYASASVAQVHRAVLWSGDIVAIKIQKDGIQKRIESDLSVLEALAQIAEGHSETMESWGVVRMVEEFKRTILNDLDFNRERRNIEIFRNNFEDDPTVYFPATWPEYSTRRVLTMEYLEGIPGNEIEALSPDAEDMNEFARRGANVYLNMIFRDNFYHADPHPGNLMLLRYGVVGIVDCGTVGKVDEALREDLENLFEAITNDDVDALVNSLWNLSKDQSDEQRQALQADVTTLLDECKGSMSVVDVSGILLGMLEIFRKYKLSVRPGLTALLRTLILLDGTARALSPNFKLQSVLEPYESEIIRHRLDPRKLFGQSRKSIREWMDFFEHLPGDLSKTLHKVRTGELHVRLQHKNLDSIVNRLVLAVVTAALILGSSLLWASKAPPLVNGVSMFGALGYIVVLILGWLLYRAIKDSGKISPED